MWIQHLNDDVKSREIDLSQDNNNIGNGDTTLYHKRSTGKVNHMSDVKESIQNANIVNHLE